ncbi:enoyl-CoA hydratase/isomerase family protein [Actibacterium pelagium]|uniref:3-hydroxyisobutyryl-CoA hydrolase n=1 Tax=Actibacterium pelagium TaxID=2029103 RepID=A0A917EIH9_9RHOB|nr:enoyl-CoA hydratase/isomerase family protein [Actibacterium pelagium]GGE45145.1 enoyl-CoA hydratase [Actibacterium pelagium]
MSDINIRIVGQTGRITLTRPKALNALSYEMALAVEDAFDAWRDDDRVKMIVMDAEGEKAFCAGGDIQEMYDTGTKGDFEYGRKFWRDEYRMNAKIFNFPKPVASFLQGFVMGGGVGVGCHGSHRVVGDSCKIAMPEVGIGLIPDVGGSLILARAPGRLGEYLGTTAARMGPGDAIFVGFADHYVPEDQWPDLIAQLEETGDAGLIEAAALALPTAPLSELQDQIDTHFGADSAALIASSLGNDDGEFAATTLKTLRRNSPLSVACTIEIIRRVRELNTIEGALRTEFRFTYRSGEQADFLEGIRAAIIDKDRNPNWRHAALEDVSEAEVAAMLAPLEEDGLKFEGEET